MIIQLLSISALYLLLNFPIMILSVAHLCGLPADVGVEAQLVTFFLTYWVMMLLPFVVLNSLHATVSPMARHPKPQRVFPIIDIIALH